MNMMQNPNAPQPPWMQQPQQPQQNPFPMFSQGQGMPQQPPTAAMGGPPQQQQGIDPATVQAMLALRQQQPKLQEIARQRKMAELLRQQGADQMQGVKVGRMYAAPNLGNLAANVYGQYTAAGMDERADADRRGVAQQEQQTAQQWFEALTGKRRGAGG